MVVNMEVQEAMDYVRELMKDKDEIESQVQHYKGILDANHVGMADSLVDSEGYPLADIDLYQVRLARHKIRCLMNDHKALMNRIEEGLHKVHALARNQKENPAPTNGTQETTCLKPFLRVNLVSPNSPAADAGIKVEDLILKFGYINYQNFKSLEDVKTMVQNSVHKPIDIIIKRGSNTISLNLTPHLWNGKDLLGCRIISIETVEI